MSPGGCKIMADYSDDPPIDSPGPWLDIRRGA